MIEVIENGVVVQKALEEIDMSMLHPGSLFSQADGPPRDDIEMSCSNRAWKQIGRKMTRARPLVAADGSFQ